MTASYDGMAARRRKKRGELPKTPDHPNRKPDSHFQHEPPMEHTPLLMHPHDVPAGPKDVYTRRWWLLLVLSAVGLEQVCSLSERHRC
jgi:hypothetical protein